MIISFFHSAQSAACNNFPKILGGNLSYTLLYNIDVFDNFIALAGGSYDTTLFTGISSLNLSPYLALTSISTGAKYYWVKALKLKPGVQFNAV
jgi:hypothetical protein